MGQFLVQCKSAGQGGGCIHVGLVAAKKPFCGHTSRFEQVGETNFKLIQPDDFETPNGSPPRIQFYFLGWSQTVFRDDFCQKCYKKLVEMKPELATDFRFK